MTHEEQSPQQIGIQSNSGGDINIEQSQVHIAGGDIHIHYPQLDPVLYPKAIELPIKWVDLCNSCKNITQKGMRRLQKKLYLEKLYLQREHVHKTFMQFLDNQESRCFVLVGKSGVGKSSFLLSLAEEMRTRQRLSQENKCIMLIYDGGEDRSIPFMEAVNQDFSQHLGRNVQNIWEEINKVDGIDKHTILLCVDAINENERAQELLKQLNALVWKSWPWLKILLISRPETWRALIKGQEIKLAESLYYQGEGTTSEAVMRSFSYSAQMHPFSSEELPQVYAKYQTEYQLQTPYEALSYGYGMRTESHSERKNSPSDQRHVPFTALWKDSLVASFMHPARGTMISLQEIISDPFNLWLIAKTYRMRVIPEYAEITMLIEDYMRELINSKRLREEDHWWLEDYLVPLMINVHHYDRIVINRTINNDNLTAAFLQNLIDTDILKQEEHGLDFEISFKHERFYEYFATKRLVRLSKVQIDQYDFFLSLIGEVAQKYSLWGPVRNALVEEANSDTILRLCRTPQQQVKEMMVNVITILGWDVPILHTENILKNLMPQEKIVTWWDKWRMLRGKFAEVSDKESFNAVKIAIEVACNLSIPGILQQANLLEDPTLRAEAVRYTYIFWQRDQEHGFKILEYLAKNAFLRFPLPPNRVALESCFTLSILIFFDHYQDKSILIKLQNIWHEVITKILHRFINKQILFLLLTVAFWILDRFPGYNILNIREFEKFFQRESDEKLLYRRLVRYIDVDASFPQDQVERDYLTAIKTDDLFLLITFMLGMVPHACNDPLGSLSLLRKLFEEAKSDINTYRYLSDITNVLENILNKNILDEEPILDEIFNFFVYAVETCQEYYARYPEYVRNEFRNAPRALYLGPYTLHCYQKIGTAKTEWLRVRIQDALLHKDIVFFNLLLMTELPFVAILWNRPKAALEVLELFFDNMRERPLEENDKDDFLKVAVNCLARLRLHHPYEVDDFLDRQHVPDEICLRVRTNESSESIGDLVNLRAWYFLRDDVILNSPELRSQLIQIFEKAADCKNLQVWFDYFVWQIVNRIDGR